jgi:AraC-like DNA-binding protein
MVYFEDNSLKISAQNYSFNKSDMLSHDHSYLTISILLSGSLIEHTPQGTKHIKSGCVLIKPAYLNHSNEFTKNCTILSLKIYDWEYYKLDFRNWKVIEQNMLLKYFLRSIKYNDKKLVLNDLNQNLTLIKNSACFNKNIPRRIKEIKEIIDNHFIDSLQIDQLAKDANIHPAYLGRTFNDYYGIDIKTYQHQLRLSFAISEMITGNKSLSQISYLAGYSDQSHFSRQFKKAFEFSPKKIASILNV